MAKKEDKTNPEEIVLDGMPGADPKTEEDEKGFEVDMNFETEEQEETEVEEESEQEVEEESPEEPEEELEEEEVEPEPAIAEDTGEETVLAEDEGNTQQSEETVEEGTDGSYDT